MRISQTTWSLVGEDGLLTSDDGLARIGLVTGSHAKPWLPGQSATFPLWEATALLPSPSRRLGKSAEKGKRHRNRIQKNVEINIKNQSSAISQYHNITISQYHLYPRSECQSDTQSSSYPRF